MATILHPSRLRAIKPVMSVSEIIASLHACTTEADYLAWQSATAASRSRLSQAALQRVESARRAVECRTRGIVAPCRLTADAEPVSGIVVVAHAGVRSPLLARARNLMERHRIPASTFGRDAIGDPQLVRELSKGRTLRPTTMARVEAYIAGLQQTEVRA